MERKRQIGREPPEALMVVRSLGFLFASCIQDLELKKPVTQRRQRAQTKKSPNKSLLSPAKGPGKREPSKIENLRAVTAPLQPIAQLSHLHPRQQRLSGEQRPPSLPRLKLQ